MTSGTFVHLSVLIPGLLSREISISFIYPPMESPSAHSWMCIRHLVCTHERLLLGMT